jgi:N6-adenosine-specific RNA methylase IME4
MNTSKGSSGAHSEKPDQFYEMVRECSPGPRLDMFARRAHDGYDAWPAEVGGARKAARA